MADWRIWILAAGVGLVVGHAWYTNYKAKPDVSFLAAGMEPQIDLIRDVAAEENWKVVCEGRSGAMTVVRLAPSFWASDESQHEVREQVLAIATITQSVSSERTECDLPPSRNRTEANGRDFALAFGSRDELKHYVEIARACSVLDTNIAPLTEDDKALLQQNGYGEISSDWLGLHATEKATEPYGPLSCYATIARRYNAGLTTD